jgi:hypothetical protein
MRMEEGIIYIKEKEREQALIEQSLHARDCTRLIGMHYQVKRVNIIPILQICLNIRDLELRVTTK